MRAHGAISAAQRRAFTCCIANPAFKTWKPTQPYHSLSTPHAPVTSISHALYLSSAVLFPCPEPGSLHESSHIKALLSFTCTDETPSRSGRLTPHSRTLNTFRFITALPGEEKKKERESRRCCLKGTSYLLCCCTNVFKLRVKVQLDLGFSDSTRGFISFYTNVEID